MCEGKHEDFLKRRACVGARSYVSGGCGGHGGVCVYLVDVGQRLFILDQHLGELQSLVWIHAHHISEQKHPVRCVAHLQKYKNAILNYVIKDLYK